MKTITIPPANTAKIKQANVLTNFFTRISREKKKPKLIQTYDINRKPLNYFGFGKEEKNSPKLHQQMSNKGMNEKKTKIYERSQFRFWVNCVTNKS